MPDLPLREGFVPRHAVTYETTARGPKIAADQVVTVPTGDESVDVPLGKVHQAGSVTVVADTVVPVAADAETQPMTVKEAVKADLIVLPEEPPSPSSRRRGTE